MKIHKIFEISENFMKIQNNLRKFRTLYENSENSMKIQKNF